jgi:hypothetical protein
MCLTLIIHLHIVGMDNKEFIGYKIMFSLCYYMYSKYCI